jgi:elongation factor P--beta-lysine ligase
LKKLGYRLYCRNCRGLVDVCECHRKEKTLPEIKPEFEMVTWCCVSYNEPVTEITELHREKNT